MIVNRILIVSIVVNKFFSLLLLLLLLLFLFSFLFFRKILKILLLSGKSLARSHLVLSSPLIPQKPLFPSSTQSLNRVKLAVHVDFSSWNSSQRRFFCHRILRISRISRKQDHVANLGQIVFSNSCQVSHFWIM